MGDEEGLRRQNQRTGANLRPAPLLPEARLCMAMGEGQDGCNDVIGCVLLQVVYKLLQIVMGGFHFSSGGWGSHDLDKALVKLCKSVHGSCFLLGRGTSQVTFVTEFGSPGGTALTS